MTAPISAPKIPPTTSPAIPKPADVTASVFWVVQDDGDGWTLVPR